MKNLPISAFLCSFLISVFAFSFNPDLEAYFYIVEGNGAVKKLPEWQAKNNRVEAREAFYAQKTSTSGEISWKEPRGIKDDNGREMFDTYSWTTGGVIKVATNAVRDAKNGFRAHFFDLAYMQSDLGMAHLDDIFDKINTGIWPYQPAFGSAPKRDMDHLVGIALWVSNKSNQRKQ